MLAKAKSYVGHGGLGHFSTLVVQDRIVCASQPVALPVIDATPGGFVAQKNIIRINGLISHFQTHAGTGSLVAGSIDTHVSIGV